MSRRLWWCAVLCRAARRLTSLRCGSRFVLRLDALVLLCARILLVVLLLGGGRLGSGWRHEHTGGETGGQEGSDRDKASRGVMVVLHGGLLVCGL
jgi:hypothetical protein